MSGISDEVSCDPSTTTYSLTAVTIDLIVVFLCIVMTVDQGLW